MKTLIGMMLATAALTPTLAAAQDPRYGDRAGVAREDRRGPGGDRRLDDRRDRQEPRFADRDAFDRTRPDRTRDDWTRSRFGGPDDRWTRSRFAGSEWNRDWRGDRRYDWNRDRVVHRNAYHLPRYAGPGGRSSYRRFAIGAGLQPSLWARDYWIADPYSFHLPHAYGAFRWVRYHDDALLVDLRSGQVVDAAYGIFW